MSESSVEVEATGETVGEAKWSALRELERLHPGVDKAAVRFQVVSEGERGLLGVGYAPARVLASVPGSALTAAPVRDESTLVAEVRALVERVADALGVECRVDVVESDEAVVATCTGGDLGVLIGRHGHTIDAVQQLAAAVAARLQGADRKEIVVDAAGYRARRRALLESVAERAAATVRRDGEAVGLEPMSAPERRIVHERLAGVPGVETWSEGAEPSRRVVVGPSGEAAPPPASE